MSDRIPFPYKYSEGKTLNKIREYVESTYSQHYTGQNDVQALDAIISSGNGLGFSVGNIQKYGFR